jgi:hypothetical protein
MIKFRYWTGQCLPPLGPAAALGALQRELMVEALDLAFSPDGSVLACATADGVKMVGLGPAR